MAAEQARSAELIRAAEEGARGSERAAEAAAAGASAAATEGATRLLTTFDCTWWSLHHCSSSLPDASAEARPVVASTNAVNASKSESSRAWG